MTRINVMSVDELMDQHLLAEYTEITRMSKYITKSLNSKTWNVSKIPATFRLNAGHVMFFYNKGLFLQKRYYKLREELKLRGFNINEVNEFDIKPFPSHYMNDWVPNEGDIAISRERIAEKIALKPNWYKKTKGQNYDY